VLGRELFSRPQKYSASGWQCNCHPNLADLPLIVGCFFRFPDLASFRIWLYTSGLNFIKPFYGLLFVFSQGWKKMKSEERHKLQKNELADWLAKTVAAIKPYQNAIIGGIIVVLLVIIVIVWQSSESENQAARSWTQLFAALDTGNSSALEKVAVDNPRSSAATSADLLAADIQFINGTNLLFVNKATANQELNKAVLLYQRVCQNASSPALLSQATLGLARAKESLGDLSAASELYAEVTSKWPDSVFAKMATRRLDDIKRTSIKEVYDRFAQFEPLPAVTPQPGAKSEIEKMPEEPSANAPGTATQTGTEEKKPEPAENNAAPMPEEKTEKPAESQPTPDSEKPAQQ
jgi:hypothetical protein